MRKKSEKIPLIEAVNRWIDIYTYFHYPANTRELAYRIAIENSRNLGYPHSAGATAVYMACKAHRVKFDINLARKIIDAHRADLRGHAGLRKETLERGESKWKLPTLQ